MTTNPSPPPQLTPVIMGALENGKRVLISGARVIYVAHSLKYGTIAGDISMCFGEDGDFFDICPGMLIHCDKYTVARFRNNVNAARRIDILTTTDAEFSVFVQPSGL